MKLIKVFIGSLTLLIGLYYLSYFILPSVTIINNSGVVLVQTDVYLPNSKLDFGTIANGQRNTLHYALTQQDGTYKYQLMLAGGDTFNGSCGYLTNSEINKRFIITVTSTHVVCDLIDSW